MILFYIPTKNNEITVYNFIIFIVLLFGLSLLHGLLEFLLQLVWLLFLSVLYY